MRLLLTVEQLAGQFDRSIPTIRRWIALPDFPAPKEIGARRRALYDYTQVAAFLDRHPELGVPVQAPSIAGDPERRISLGDYAVQTGRNRTVFYQYARNPVRYQTFPTAGDDGLYRLGDLATWDANRPGSGAR